MTITEDHSAFFAEPALVTSGDGVQMKGDRYVLPTTDGLDGKWHPHTRVTAISSVLPNTRGLGIWQADRVAWAMAQRPDLCARLQAVPVTDVATIREVRAKAEIVAATDEGANLGTATHTAIARYVAGEAIETLHRVFHPDIRAFAALLAEYGLTVQPDLIERVVRMRDYDIAGRLDYIMAESDGTLVVVDLKTKGKPEFVHEVATQLAPYANADEMFDPATGRYVPMPPVRRDYALMIHIHPGSGEATIKKINIRLGLWSVEVAKNAVAYSRMTHLATPYVMPNPVKPADDTLVSAPQTGRLYPCVDCGCADHRAQGDHAPTCSQSAPKAPSNGHGTPDPAFVAEVAATTLAESYERHGAPAVAAPDPASYGAPVGTPAPAPYVPQKLPARAEAVLMTDGKDGVETEASEILDAFKSKSKVVMQEYARRYGITDLAHHKAHIAKSIALARADRRKAGLDVEPGGDKINSSDSNGGESTRHPQTMAEAGFPPAPATLPGRPAVGPEAQVLRDIDNADTVTRIVEIWSAWTSSGRTWEGNVQAAADAKVAAIQAADAGRAAGEGSPF